jgi:hypothetical protein
MRGVGSPTCSDAFTLCFLMPLALLVAPTDPGAGDAASRRDALAWLRGQLARYQYDIVIAGAGRSPQEAIEKAAPTINPGDSVLVHVSGRLVGRDSLGFSGDRSVLLGLLTEVFAARAPADLSFMLELTYDDDPTDPMVPHALVASAIQSLGGREYGYPVFAAVRRSSVPAGRIDFTRAVLGPPGPGVVSPPGEVVLAAMHARAMESPENRAAADGFLFLRGAPSGHVETSARVDEAPPFPAELAASEAQQPSVLQASSQELSGERVADDPRWKHSLGIDEQSGLRGPRLPSADLEASDPDASDPTDPRAPEIRAASLASLTELEEGEPDAVGFQEGARSAADPLGVDPYPPDADPTDPLAPEVRSAEPLAPELRAADPGALAEPSAADPHPAELDSLQGPPAGAFVSEAEPLDPHELRVSLSDLESDSEDVPPDGLATPPGMRVPAAGAPLPDSNTLDGIEAAAFRTPLTAAPYRIAFEIHRRQCHTDAALLAAMALEELNAAQTEHQELVDQFRTVGPVRIRAPIDPATWGLLRAPGFDDALAGLFAAIERAAVAVRLDELRESRRLPFLDRNQRLSETSTASVVRSFQWAARVLGMRCPDLYAMDDAPGVAMMCAAEPSTALGRAVLSGRSAKDLAFLAGRHLTYYRPEHHVLLYYPSRESLTELLYAAVQVGLPESGSPSVPPGVHLLRVRLAQRIGDPGRAALKQALRVLDARGGQAKVGAWMRAVELTAARVGLFLCGDLAVATGFLRAQQSGIADLSSDERRGDLTAFCSSRAHVAVRARLVVTGIDDQVAPSNGGGQQRVAS